MADRLVFDRQPKNLLIRAAVDLPDPPLGRRLLVVEEEHVEPVSAPVDDVAAGALDAAQLADRAVAQHLARRLKRRQEAPLVVEGELDAALVARARHRARFAPGRGHRLLAAEGARAGFPRR